MLAKSAPTQLHLPYSALLAQWLRGAVSMVALFASLAALVLILHQQYGDRLFSSSYTRILSIKPADGRSATVDPRAFSEENRHRALSEFLARKYKVSETVTRNLVDIAHSAGHQLSLDPLLIIAVIAVESRFNPIAESVAGAKGLMQVIPKYHTDKLDEYGGEHAVFDPEANIRVGSQILKDYLRRTGNISIALQMYAGALNDGEDVYTNKVLSEKQRLQQVVTQSTRQRPKVAAAPVRQPGVEL
jgi:soluble lytic murein transglycosylase-like protein